MSHIPRPMEASDAGSHVKPSPRDPFPKFNLKTVPYENPINLKWKGDNLNFKNRVLTMGGGIIDPEIAVASQKYLAEQYKAEVERWGYIDSERWDNFYTWMYDDKLIPKKLEPGTGFTNDYLPKQ